MTKFYKEIQDDENFETVISDFDGTGKDCLRVQIFNGGSDYNFERTVVSVLHVTFPRIEKNIADGELIEIYEAEFKNQFQKVLGVLNSEWM